MVDLLIDDEEVIHRISDKFKVRSLCLQLDTTSLNSHKAAILHLMQQNLAYLSSLSVKYDSGRYEPRLVEDIITAFLALPNAKELRSIEFPDVVLASLSQSRVERLHSFHVISKSIHGAASAGAAIRRMSRLTDLVVTVPNTTVLEACLGGAAGHIPSIKKIQLCGDLLCRIEDERPEPAVGASSIAGIARALGSASNLTTLRLDFQMAASDILQAIASILDAGGMPALSELVVRPHDRERGAAEGGMLDLLGAVSRRGSIKALDVESLTHDLGSPLTRLIRAQAGLRKSGTNQGLRELRMQGLECEEATSVLNALVEADHGIERVRLHPGIFSDLEPRHYAALARAVGPGKRIRALHLCIESNVILAKLKTFSEVLQARGSLTELELQRSNSMYVSSSMNDPDATCLLAALGEKLPLLESLILSDFEFPKGATAELLHLKNLRHLELACTMEPSDRLILADVLAGMRMLRHLSLFIGDSVSGKLDSQCLLDGLLERSEAAESGRAVASLEHLLFGNLSLDCETIQLLAEVIHANHRLRTLNVDMSEFWPGKFNEQTVGPLVVALQRHTTVCDIRPRSAFTHKAYDAVCEALEKGPIALQKRRTALLCFRRGFEAKRDAGMVFPAARDGRPLELGKRLRLGVLAGGARAVGMVGGCLASALEAACLGGHDDCMRVLEGVLGEQEEGDGQGEGEDR